MDIITQKSENVNIYTHTIPQTITEILLSDGNKWTLHKTQSKIIAERLFQIKQYARGYRMKSCAEIIQMNICGSCGQKHIINARLCRDRFCPTCQWRLSMRRFANMMQIVQGLREENPEAEWQFVTLTVENCQPSDLANTINEMSRSWNCIWSRRSTKKMPILGWARSMEVTYNQKTRTFHPHYHVMILWEDGYSPSVSEQKWLENTWIETVKLHSVSQAQFSAMVRARDSQLIPSICDQEEDEAEAVLNAVLETYKYTIKSNELQMMPLGVFKILDDLLRGRRMVAFGGAVKKYAAEMGLSDHMESADDDISDDPAIARCASCKSVDLVNVVGRWTGDGYLWRREY